MTLITQKNNTEENSKNNHNIEDSMYKISKKKSKYADFMKAYKVRTPKYKFYVERGGDKKNPVVLLIMGLGAQSLAWPNTFCKKIIDAGFHVIRFDNRDIGKSSKIKHKNEHTKQHLKPMRQVAMMSQFKLGLKLPELPTHSKKKLPPVPYDLYDMAEDTHQLLNALRIEECHVVGMSMGGMIAQILSAKHPDRVITLGLLSTSNNRAFLPTPNFQFIKHLARPTPKKSDLEAHVEHTVHMLSIISSPDYFDKKETTQKIRTFHQRRLYLKGTARQQMAILATGSLTKIDAQIQQPTVIVHGGSDKIFHIAHAHAIAKMIPHAKLHLIDELGHDIPLALVNRLGEIFIENFQEVVVINQLDSLVVKNNKINQKTNDKIGDTVN